METLYIARVDFIYYLDEDWDDIYSQWGVNFDGGSALWSRWNVG